MKRNPLGELINLKHLVQLKIIRGTSKKMLACASSERIDQQVKRFTTGLVDFIRRDVELNNPSNLVQAMSLVRAFQQKDPNLL